MPFFNHSPIVHILYKRHFSIAFTFFEDWRLNFYLQHFSFFLILLLLLFFFFSTAYISLIKIHYVKIILTVQRKKKKTFNFFSYFKKSTSFTMFFSVINISLTSSALYSFTSLKSLRILSLSGQKKKKPNVTVI